ncbi:unnamed protein product [Danaus chrysippus]|uniref:(African queen) hypothetical protein n=1 Tax=Danaus chrysippus TaxID=151541 RepID=A0A8J2QNP9_9NEOP|nr:unnamed protein product [Danaus chrysippus]
MLLQPRVVKDRGEMSANKTLQAGDETMPPLSWAGTPLYPTMGRVCSLCAHCVIHCYMVCGGRITFEVWRTARGFFT